MTPNNNKIVQKPVKSDKLPQGGDNANQLFARESGVKVNNEARLVPFWSNLAHFVPMITLKSDKIQQNSIKRHNSPQAGDHFWAN